MNPIALAVTQILLVFGSSMLLSGTIVHSSVAFESLGKVGTVVIVQAMGAILALLISRWNPTKKLLRPIAVAFAALAASTAAYAAPEYTILWYLPLLSRVVAGQWLQAFVMSRIPRITNGAQELQALNHKVQIGATVGSICGLGLGPIVASHASIDGIFLLDVLLWVGIATLIPRFTKAQITPAAATTATPIQDTAPFSLSKLYFFTMIVWCAGGIFQVLEVPLLIQRFRFPADKISLVFIVTVLANIAAVTLLKRTREVQGWSKIFGIAVVGMLGASALYLITHQLWIAFAAIILIGAFNGAFSLSQTNIILAHNRGAASMNALLTLRLMTQMGIISGSLVAQAGSAVQIAIGIALLCAFALLQLGAGRVAAALALTLISFAQPSHAATPFRSSVMALPKTQDPTEITDSSSGLVLNQIFESIYEYDSDGALTPNLAKGHIWNADQLELTITIDQKKTFTDGSPLNAQVVADSIKRVIRKMKTGVRWAFGELEGFEDYVADPVRNEAKLGVQAAAEDKLRFRFKRPFGIFPQILAAPYFAIVKSAGAGWIGTGPYRVIEQNPNRWRLELRNPDRYPSAPADVRFELLNNFSQADKAAADGKLDFLESSSEHEPIPGFQYFDKTPFFQSIIVILNAKSPKLATAANRCSFLSEFRNSLRASNNSWRPVSLGLHFSWDLLSQPMGAESPVKPRKGDIQIMYADSIAVFNKDLISNLQQKMKKADGAVRFQRENITNLLSRAKQSRFEVALLGFAPDYAHPDALLTPLIGSGQQFNYTGIKIPEVDKLLESARRSVDREEQNRVYTQVFALLNKHCVVAFLGSQSKKLALREGWDLQKLNPIGLHKLSLTSITRRSP